MNKQIVIDGKEYVAREAEGEKLMIVVVDNRGLTFVGWCDLSGDNEQIRVRKARCIIYWGTTGHLAELVQGPTEKTKLGTLGDVIVFRRNLVAAYEVAEGSQYDCG